jgi:hypothetical protein
MIRITKDLNAEVVEIGDVEKTEETPYKSHISTYSIGTLGIKSTDVCNKARIIRMAQFFRYPNNITTPSCQKPKSKGIRICLLTF